MTKLDLCLVYFVPGYALELLEYSCKIFDVVVCIEGDMGFPSFWFDNVFVCFLSQCMRAAPLCFLYLCSPRFGATK